MAQYKFVDFHSGSSYSKWLRTNNLTPLLEKFNYNDCFATIQQYKNAEMTGKEEPYIAPLYFDLDYKSDPSKAQKEAITVIKFLTETLCIDSLAVRVYFSGSKGFHIIVHEKVFSIEPFNYLNKVFKLICGYLSLHLSVNDVPLETLDSTVYTVRRMMRIPNTKHADTNLYKIELTHDELNSLSSRAEVV